MLITGEHVSSTYITQNAEGEEIRTPEGEAFLAKTVTNTTGNVYTFYDSLEPTVIAAAMARLSRYGGSMRDLLLTEFASQDSRTMGTMRRVLTQFGDEAVQQLDYVPLIVENASCLLAKQLEWGRLAAYLEQQSGDIRYDQKRSGHYMYYTPQELPPRLRARYEETMDKIFANYAALLQQLIDWYTANDKTLEAGRDVAWRVNIREKAAIAARGLLPGATTATVGIVGSAKAIDNLITHLLSQNLPEAQVVGGEILEEVRKQHGAFFEREATEGGGLTEIEYRRRTRQQIATLAQQMPHVSQEESGQQVALLDFTPQDELELLTHMLFAHSTVSFEALQKELGGWSHEQQVQALHEYMGERKARRHKPGRALEIAHYTFEVISDYATFSDFQRHRMVDALEWQQHTPYLGYEVPEVVRKAGLEALYRQTHELSKTLYTSLISEGFAVQAQYATLVSARLRWKVTMNARAAFHFVELRTPESKSKSYHQIAKAIHAEIARVHPRLAEAMAFGAHCH